MVTDATNQGKLAVFQAKTSGTADAIPSSVIVQLGYSATQPTGPLEFTNTRLIGYSGAGNSMQKYGGGEAQNYDFGGQLDYPRKMELDLQPTPGFTNAGENMWVSMSTLNTQIANRLSWRMKYSWQLMSKTAQLVLKAQQMAVP